MMDANVHREELSVCTQFINMPPTSLEISFLPLEGKHTKNEDYKEYSSQLLGWERGIHARVKIKGTGPRAAVLGRGQERGQGW